ncbi:nucleoside hydrolase [Clostridium sp. YIM B02515]|uniref:Nucleoside hydrolase n=1 Tax=Clostridium rhizosphaerae TaxID=2803861 RepID=A0ABS1TC70_9CLOT|nr:nucleoside hydrolase [Clostridium rhizosphaerae]MBL4936963.1 nucleoside hydrolase [Clostridium rhizosphaerae]
MKERRKVIIDCDPGIDDSLALLLALKSKELEVLGITIVCGNVPAKQGVQNALKALELCKSLHVPVYLGEETPLKRELVTAQDTHGEDGVGECFFEEINGGIVKNGAAHYIIETLAKENNVSIIALGPLTNIAKALMKDKEAFQNLDEFISMGGAFRIHGNCSPVAEFNYWVDPQAADYVYKNLGKKIHMVGLDVTRKIVLTPNTIEFIEKIGGELGKYIKDITRFYVDFHWKQEGIIGCVINDPLAVAYFIDRSICRGFSSSVEIVHEGIAMGQSIVDAENFYKREDNAFILTEVDFKRFMLMFLERLFPEKINLIQNTQGVM